MDICIDLIKINNRYRQDMGDIQLLADSIEELGQLQPIAIDANYNLIFGERRIKACQLLDRNIITGNIIHLDDLVKGEYAENEIRKDFTISECVEIGKAIEVGLGERRGNKTKSIPPNLEELKGKETSQIAAEKSGLGSKNNYRSAKKVVEKGSPELVEKMDSKEISISAAAKISELDQPDQEEIIEKIESGTKPAQAIKQKTGRPANNDQKEDNELYVKAAKYFFAYNACHVEDLQKHLKLTKKETADIIKELEKNEVVSKPNKNGSRYLGLMPKLNKKTPEQEPAQDKAPEEQPEAKQLKESDQDERLRIDHLAHLARQLFTGEFLGEVADLNLTDSYYRTTFKNTLRKGWFDNCFYKPDFSAKHMTCLIRQQSSQKMESSKHHSIIIVPLQPDVDYFKLLTDESDELCLPHKKLSLLSVTPGNEFYTKNIAIFYFEGEKKLKTTFETLFSQIGSVWK